MIVKELIEKLREFDDDLYIVVAKDYKTRDASPLQTIEMYGYQRVNITIGKLKKGGEECLLICPVV